MQSAWSITSVAVPLIFTAGAALMFGPSIASHWAACAAFLLAAVWMGMTGIMWFLKQRNRDFVTLAKMAGILAFSIIICPVMIYFAWPVSAQIPPGGVNGNCNNFGNNNTNCNTFNLGPVPRRIPDKQVADISAALRKSNPSGIIEVQTDMMACPDCDGYAKQIAAILSSAPNLIIKSVRNGMTMTPLRGIAIGVRDTNKVPDDVQLIMKAFGSIGANLMTVQWRPNYEDSDAVFVIAQPVS
jgi:hypothetical protein